MQCILSEIMKEAIFVHITVNVLPNDRMFTSIVAVTKAPYQKTHDAA